MHIWSGALIFQKVLKTEDDMIIPQEVVSLFQCDRKSKLSRGRLPAQFLLFIYVTLPLNKNARRQSIKFVKAIKYFFHYISHYYH